jgi:hypothetical protein
VRRHSRGAIVYRFKPAVQFTTTVIGLVVEIAMDDSFLVCCCKALHDLQCIFNRAPLR